MKTSKQTYRTSFAVAAIAASLVMSAHAEYRCATPEQLTNAEKQACELARQDTPDALIHFVNRTKGTYNLLADDYVSKADTERWELAKSKAPADSPAAAKARTDMGNVSNDR